MHNPYTRTFSPLSHTHSPVHPPINTSTVKPSQLVLMASSNILSWRQLICRTVPRLLADASDQVKLDLAMYANSSHSQVPYIAHVHSSRPLSNTSHSLYYEIFETYASSHCKSKSPDTNLTLVSCMYRNTKNSGSRDDTHPRKVFDIFFSYLNPKA
jgi:hypothetical protein